MSNIKNAGPNIKFFVKFLLITLIAATAFTGDLKAVETDLPFYPGEKLTYQIKWSFIPAGEAVLEVLPLKTVESIDAFHFVLHARTNAFVDHFYKVRNRIDAYTDTGMTHSILFRQQQIEGGTKRNFTINFDWNIKTAQYSNINKKRKPISILPGSFDPLAVLYFARLLELNENTDIEVPITDGKKCVIGRARVVKRETITVSSGTYDTYLLRPELKHIGGVFKKSKNAKINVWITADKRRIPVKIESEVIVGRFIGELVSAEGLTKK
jgi:hypothetical protein